MSSNSKDIDDSARKREQQLLQKMKEIANARKIIKTQNEQSDKNYQELLAGDRNSSYSSGIEKDFERYFLSQLALNNIKKRRLPYDSQRIVRQYLSMLKDPEDFQRLKDAYQAFIKNRVLEAESTQEVMRKEIRIQLSPVEIRNQLQKSGYITKEISKKLQGTQDKFINTIKQDRTQWPPNGKILAEQLDEARFKNGSEYQSMVRRKRSLESELKGLIDVENVSNDEKISTELQEKN